MRSIVTSRWISVSTIGSPSMPISYPFSPTAVKLYYDDSAQACTEIFFS
jgi:hypothetical protein